MRMTIGAAAHVDAGKTTLCEAMLALSGAIRRPGRVDAGNALLDAHPVERARGITVFSDEARLVWKGADITLIDTPGHVDFSAEAERAAMAMDCAVLVVSAVEGVQSHSEALWRLFARQNTPVFFFINKTDRVGADVPRVLREIRTRLTADVFDFMQETDDAVSAPLMEYLAERDDGLLARYLDGETDGAFWHAAVRRAVARRGLFPCLQGAALTGEGVERLLDTLVRLGAEPAEEDAPLRALVYKVRNTAAGRFCFLKVLSGVLSPRANVALPDGTDGKVTDLRAAQGAKLLPVKEARAGQTCAAAGLSARCGDFVGERPAYAQGRSAAALSARVVLPEGILPRTALAWFRVLEDEDPMLAVSFVEETDEIDGNIMGEVQLEVLSAVVRERFGAQVSFAPPQILYRETIAAPVIGYGHFEPLRHYAEAHVLLEPLPRGAGVEVASACSLDVLPQGCQSAVLSALSGPPHVGVLTGAPLTDVRLTLVTGRAHEKHTEGGDFREAARRAVRQGLMCAESVLLEPYYAFTAVVPAQLAGRVMTDVTRLGGECEPPEETGDVFCIRGRGPVASFLHYGLELTRASGGRASFSAAVEGFAPCRSAQEVIAARAYDPEADRENPAASIFCSHGAGFPVRWQDAPRYMHIKT